jgi:NAD(P)H dehydrogenase (quinone)
MNPWIRILTATLVLCAAGAWAVAAAAAPPHKIIISGASGRLGKEVVEILLERDLPATDLILVSRTPDKLSAFAGRGASVRFGDFDKPESLDTAFAGGEKLLLISTDAIGPRRLTQHLAAIDAAKRMRIQRVVYTSITAADRMAKAGVLTDHYETEKALRRSGIPWVILRNQSYAEAELGNASGSINSGEYHTNAAGGRVGYVAHRDCAEAAAAVLLTGGNDRTTYDITGPELIGSEDLARILGEVTGKSIRVVNLTDAAYFDELTDLGVPKEYAELLTSLNKAARDGILSVRTPDFERLTRHKPKSLHDVFDENRAKLLAPAAP